MPPAAPNRGGPWVADGQDRGDRRSQKLNSVSGGVVPDAGQGAAVELRARRGATYNLSQGPNGWGNHARCLGLLLEGRAKGAVVGCAGVPQRHVDLVDMVKPLWGLLTDVLPRQLPAPNALCLAGRILLPYAEKT